MPLPLRIPRRRGNQSRAQLPSVLMSHVCLHLRNVEEPAMKKRTFLLLICSVSMTVAEAAEPSHTTDFNATENPISEGAVWNHNGLDWTKVATSNGIAYGTQTGTGGYDDSYAYLSGFPADHSAVAKIFRAPNIDSSCTHEVEILLRWSDSAHSAQGYECNISFDGGYAQIVRWNGAIGNFTVLGGGSFPALKDGDLFKATVVGNRIAIYVNDTKVAEVTDSTFQSGNPGMGFFRRECGKGSDFGFTSFTATSGSSTSVRPNPPTDVRAE